MSGNSHFGICGPWQDCDRMLPYRDVDGRFVLFPMYPQRQRVVGPNGIQFRYREREPTAEEWSDNAAW